MSHMVFSLTRVSGAPLSAFLLARTGCLARADVASGTPARAQERQQTAPSAAPFQRLPQGAPACLAPTGPDQHAAQCGIFLRNGAKFSRGRNMRRRDFIPLLAAYAIASPRWACA